MAMPNMPPAYQVEAEEIIDYEVVPGTVYLVGGAHHRAVASQDIVLYPRPSADVKDPLRWSKWRKSYHLFLLFWYSSILGALTNWESPIYLNLAAAYKTAITNLNIGQAFLLLLLGVGNVFFVPLSNKFGRRGTYMWTLLLVFFSEIWQARSTNIDDYQGAHVILGIGAAPFEAMVAISISDIFFAHERGSALGVYVFGLAFGSFVGPICSGYIVEAQGWRWIYWWGAILTGALLLAFYFTFEESRFIRPADTQEGVAVPLPETMVEAAVTRSSSAEHESKGYKIGEELQREVTTGPKVGEVFETTQWRLQTSLWKTFPCGWHEVFREFWSPIPCATLPAVIWCGLNYGTCVSWLAVIGTTVAEVFAPPPYLFSNSALGLIWISPMIGSLLGAYYSGPLNDRFTLWRSNRNKGFREPEFRLFAFLPSALIMPCGLIMYGVTSAHGMHWIIPIVGTGFVGFGLSVGGAVTMSYILDCYKDIDTQVITAIILIRNLVGFAITWGIQPWIKGMGQQDAFITVGVLSFVVTGAAAGFIVFGKAARRMTAKRYRSLATKAGAY